MRVDVEGRLDALLEQSFRRLSLVEARPVLLQAETSDGPEAVQARHDMLELSPDDGRIHGAHARPSRSRKTWIDRRWALRSFSVSQYRREARD